MNTIDYNTAVADKKRRAFATFPAGHNLPPVTGEVFRDQDAAILRLKDWSCTQGFAAALGHGEHKKRQLQEILCSRHGKKTRNTHKLTEKARVRPHSFVNHNECPYKIKIRYYKSAAQWSINVVNDDHNHDMLEDPFQLPEHQSRDPDKATVKEHAQDLRTAALPYSKARRVMRIKQPLQKPSQIPSEGRMSTPSPLLPDPALEDFTNIDDFDDLPPLSPGPSKSALPLIEWPTRISQQRRFVLPEEYDLPSTSATTRAKRGIGSKSYKQQRLESQEGHKAKEKANRQTLKEAAAARKTAKAMKPRTEDVSQLEDALAKLGSSPPLPE